MDQVSSKQKRIPGLQMEDLTLNLILELPSKANHKFMTSMDNGFGPATRSTLQGERQSLDTTVVHFFTKNLPNSAGEWHPRPFTRFSKDDFFFLLCALK